MIKTFRHAGIEAFFRTGSKAGIQPKHASKLQNQLGALQRASKPTDLAVPGWRLTFRFEGTDVVLLDYQDYH